MNSSNTNSILIAIALSCVPLAANAYPEFQSYAEKKSGRPVDCAMCHMNEHGPVGEEDGQIGKLTHEELNMLNQARGALEPGSEIRNPILNQFGNEIVKSIGMKAVLEAKGAPEKLPQLLGDKHDTDSDGIPDSKEFVDGTSSINPYHGDPWALFMTNLMKYKREVVLAVAAVLLLDFGFVNLIKGLYLTAKAKRMRPTT